MDGMNDHERAIACPWAIEALASFKQVDASLLHDLIAMAPTLPEDTGNNAKEMVALKCLESLFSPCNVMSSDVPSSQHSKIGFNLSETCENVLKRIVSIFLCSVNVSDDWNIISKKMKCDASYVLQSTEQNQIRLHGKELLGDLSERERCDFAENQMGTMDGSTALENGRGDCTSSNRCGQSNGDAVHKSQSENHLNATSMPQDKSLDEARQYSCVDQTKHDSCLHLEPRISSVAPPDGTQHKVSAKVFNFNSEHNFHSADGPQEKSISENGNGLVAKNLADENHKSVIGSDDCCVISKKVKWDPSYVLLCIEKKQIPLHGRELLEDSSERDAPLPERERCDLAESQMGTMAKGKVIEDGHNDRTTSKRCGQSTDHAVNKSQSENPCNTGSLPRDTFQDEAPMYAHTDEVKDDGGLHPEQRESCVAAPDETLHKVSAEVFNRNSELGILVKVSLPASTDEPQQKSIADEGKDNEHCPEP
ncbi:hypothetical protein DVH24_005045 [Malus domestica]|uniref:Uncharacterized protein n=1 Tax=Malus domestica TaxID=3750 RepID=A0A498II07_MALDO|nr:hypothetical protein DVH24_005045 [Malus domestica]